MCFVQLRPNIPIGQIKRLQLLQDMLSRGVSKGVNKVNNIYTIGHILELYAHYRSNNRISDEKILSVAAAVRELARSNEDYDEEIKE